MLCLLLNPWISLLMTLWWLLLIRSGTTVEIKLKQHINGFPKGFTQYLLLFFFNSSRVVLKYYLFFNGPDCPLPNMTHTSRKTRAQQNTVPSVCRIDVPKSAKCT